MFIPVLGTPSALTAWVVTLANTIVRVRTGHLNFIAAVSLEDLRDQMSKRGPGGVVFHIDCPQRGLVDFLMDVSGPLVLVRESPLTVATYVNAARSLNWFQSARFTTQSVTTLSAFSQRPNTYFIDESVISEPAAAFVADFLDRFGIVPSPEEMEQIMLEVGPPAGGPSTVEAALRRFFEHYRNPDEVEAAKADVPAFAVDVMNQYARPEAEWTEFEWPPAVFHLLDGPEQYADTPAGMIGPARVLIGGHSLHLPRGSWTGEVILQVSDNFSGNRLHADVLVEDQIADGIISKFPKFGTVVFELHFENRDPFFPVQFRVVTLEGALEGEVYLQKVLIRRS
jgi:hypothetical protein